MKRKILAAQNLFSRLKLKVDPHVVLILLVIMFVVLLFATENVFKSTLILQ
jgi:hypothetical protein